MTPSTLHAVQSRTQKVPVLRVKREFRRPEVVAWLETVDEETLAAMVTGEEDFELTPEEIEGIREAEREIAAGHYVKDEDVEQWVKSLGTDHELPKPKCQCGCE